MAALALRLLVALALLFAMSGGVRANADVPPLSPEARAAGFVDVRSVVPNALIDLRYATPNNFTHTQLYPANARCLVHESMAPGAGDRCEGACLAGGRARLLGLLSAARRTGQDV